MNLATRCPVCYSGESATLYAVSAAEAAQHFVLREDNLSRHVDLESNISKLWGGTNCCVRECAQCRFIFSDPHVAGDATFYNLAYERSGYPTDKWEYRRTVAELSSTQFRAERVLEVGSGFGFFLDQIAEVYVPRSGITALEYSDQAINVLTGKRYSAHKQDLHGFRSGGCFNAIFLFQVLEHMDDIDKVFARVAGLLVAGSPLFIAVPNTARILFNEQNGSLLDCPPNHISRWSPDALKIVGARHGLRLTAHEIEPFSLREFVKEDIVYSYLRQAQTRGTLANRSLAIRSTPLGRLLGPLTALALAPRRLGVWRKAARAENLGGSLWAKLLRVD